MGGLGFGRTDMRDWQWAQPAFRTTLLRPTTLLRFYNCRKLPLAEPAAIELSPRNFLRRARAPFELFVCLFVCLLFGRWEGCGLSFASALNEAAFDFPSHFPSIDKQSIRFGRCGPFLLLCCCCLAGNADGRLTLTRPKLRAKGQLGPRHLRRAAAASVDSSAWAHGDGPSSRSISRPRSSVGGLSRPRPPHRASACGACLSPLALSKPFNAPCRPASPRLCRRPSI